jgi:serine/threonine protein kinase
LKEDPPEPSDAARQVSPALDRIVRRCLEKNPEQRFQSARDLAFALSALSGTDVPGTQGASYPFWSPDGAYVGFFANGKLQKTALSGGTPQVLATACRDVAGVGEAKV